MSIFATTLQSEKPLMTQREETWKRTQGDQ
jgi:hypothetical protein